MQMAVAELCLSLIRVPAGQHLSKPKERIHTLAHRLLQGERGREDRSFRALALVGATTGDSTHATGPWCSQGLVDIVLLLVEGGANVSACNQWYVGE